MDGCPFLTFSEGDYDSMIQILTTMANVCTSFSLDSRDIYVKQQPNNRRQLQQEVQEWMGTFETKLAQRVS